MKGFTLGLAIRFTISLLPALAKGKKLMTLAVWKQVSFFVFRSFFGVFNFFVRFFFFFAVLAFHVFISRHRSYEGLDAVYLQTLSKYGVFLGFSLVFANSFSVFNF
jgi:hypothetical protein